MKNWEDYKGTMNTEAGQFGFARSGNTEALRELRLTREQLNQKNHKGHSPLMLASYNGHLEMVRFLIECGADVESRDGSGNTVLMGAAFKGELDIVRLLVESGADAGALSAKGQAALDFALMFGCRDVALYLQSRTRSPAGTGLKNFVFAWIKFLFSKRRPTHG